MLLLQTYSGIVRAPIEGVLHAEVIGDKLVCFVSPRARRYSKSFTGVPHVVLEQPYKIGPDSTSVKGWRLREVL